METLTPMLKQYREIKARYNNCILFFRLGDFYEMFDEDARKASGILDIVLTSRGAGKSGRTPMCGIPYHSAEGYIAKLIKSGMKVAICEQVEDPALAKGIVRREVIRIVTSGTYIDESSPESRCLIALSCRDKKYALAFTDTASGIIQTNEYDGLQKLIEIISKMAVYECIFPQAEEDRIKEIFRTPLLSGKDITLSPCEDWTFNLDLGKKALQEHFHTHNLKGFGIEDMPLSISACGALLEYVKQLHKQPLRHLHRISLYTDSEYAFISPAACYGLGIESLMQTIDHTLSSPGRRKFKDWLYRPLKSKEGILQRQEAVTLLKDNPQARQGLGKLLRNTPDIEKSISRISCGCGCAKDLLALRNTLQKQPAIQDTLGHLSAENSLFHLADVPGVRELLDKAINPDLPLTHAEGKIIAPGYSRELDGLRGIQENGRDWLKNLQAQEIKRTGINSLKIGYNQVFGYYIEISKANLNKAPAEYLRKQTLTNGERYITPELKEFEEKILGAEEKILQIESKLIEEIFKTVLDSAADLHAFSSQLATLDALHSLSILSENSGYIRPEISEGFEIKINDGRHPVVEKAIREPFIPNDLLLDTDQSHLITLTGPNMAGKSTYIRQAAILVIMAQMGSYIPASYASIGITDKIFTRIGAHDEITKGQSTFMVEMSETAGILNNLSERSLVVLDEIGRGTSTFDGLSLAWAISEFLAKAKVRTLFATHFHELTALAEEFSGVKNYNVSVKEWNEEIIFLHKIIPGGSDDSYGIYVAQLAGIPKDVLRRAEHILTRLELNSNLQGKIRYRLPAQDQLTFFENNDTIILDGIRKEIYELDIDSLTPIQALNKLHKLKERLKDNE